VIYYPIDHIRKKKASQEPKWKVVGFNQHKKIIEPSLFHFRVKENVENGIRDKSKEKVWDNNPICFFMTNSKKLPYSLKNKPDKQKYNGILRF
jgi:hypothetical protein